MDRALAAISVGSLKEVYSGPPHLPLPPMVVQVLQARNLGPSNQAQERYRIVVSDTEHYVQCMLSTQLNSLVKNGDLKTGVIVKLKSYQSNQVKDRRVLIVIDLEVLPQYDVQPKLGEPQSLEKHLHQAKLEPGQPHEAVTAAMPNPAAGTSALAFYGNGPAVIGGGVPHRGDQRFDSKGGSRNAGGGGHISPIEALSPYQNKWTIKARVVHKSEIKTWKNTRGTGKLFTVNFIDETGEIRATGFNDQCDAFYDLLQEGQVYYVSKCRVNMAKKQFSNVNNDYELSFEKDTEVEKCLDQSDVPQVKFNFISLGDLPTVDKDAMVDVIGVVKEIGQSGEIISKNTNKPYDKREITLVDTSGYSTCLTVWGALAKSWETPVESVIALKGVKVSDFGGRSLSMLSSSSLTADPDIDEAHKLKGWYDAQGRNETFSSHRDLAGIGAAGGRKDPYKNLNQIIDEKLGHGEKQEYFTTKATIVYIKQENAYYPACLTEKCNRKVVLIGDAQWRCEMCDKTHPRPLHRYILTLSVNDAFNQAWLNCFDDAGREIMGMSADELVAIRERGDGERAYNAAFAEANGKEYIFKCRSKLDTYNGTERVRHSVVSVQHINYAAEANKLAEMIKLYSMD